jgi:hypothetical protein
MVFGDKWVGKTLYSIGIFIMNKRELVSRITITKMMMVLI